MTGITTADLSAIAGKKVGATGDKLAKAFNRYAAEHGVTSPKAIALFLAHVSVETGGFAQLAENMNYSAKRLMEVWPARFKTIATAKHYANKPEKLANYVYGDRLGNKGRPNAGWLYRGSGPGQTTGYENFLTVEKATGIPFTTEPDLMRDPDMGMKGALILWQKWNMNRYAEAGQVTESRKRWNGGTHGLAEVKAANARGLARNLSVGPGKEPDEPKPGPATPVKDMAMSKGDKGPIVEELQKNLNTLGLEVQVTGIYDDATEDAVTVFQMSNKDIEGNPLKADGMVGSRTSKAIAEALLKPKLDEAKKTVPPSATKEVKEKFNVFKWAWGVLATCGAAILSWFASLEWQQIVAVFGGIVVLLILIVVGERWIIGALKRINEELSK